jgi:hypothetical protein
MVTDPEQLPLRDIHLPEAVYWWPPAPGWWMLAFLLGALILTGYWLWKRNKTHRPRSLKTLSFEALGTIRRDYAQHCDSQRLVRELSTLLRRISVSYWPRENSASLTGSAWLSFLDRNLESKPFSRGLGKVLIEAPYRPDPEIEAEALLALCDEWIGTLPEPTEGARS